MVKTKKKICFDFSKTFDIKRTSLIMLSAMVLSVFLNSQLSTILGPIMAFLMTQRCIPKNFKLL